MSNFHIVRQHNEHASETTIWRELTASYHELRNVSQLHVHTEPCYHSIFLIWIFLVVPLQSTAAGQLTLVSHKARAQTN